MDAIDLLLQDREALGDGASAAVPSCNSDQSHRSNRDETLSDSERPFQAIFEAVSLAICLIDSQGEFVHWNRQFEKLLVRSQDEIKSLSFSDIVYRGDVGSAWSSLRNVLDQREDRFQITLRVLRKDGSIELCNTLGTVVHVSGGSPRKIVVTIYPVAGDDQVKRELAEQTARLREAQAIAHVGSFHWTIATDTLVWSDELYRIFGVTPSEFSCSYSAYLELVHPSQREEVHEYVQQVLTTRKPKNYEFQLVRPDGEVRWAISRCRPVFDVNGEPLAIEGTCQDITDRKRGEDEISQRQSQMAHVSRLSMLGEMVAGIAHEITQPLTALVNFTGACGALLEHKSPDLAELRDYVEEIRSQSTRAGKIVQSLRSLSRRAETHRAPCDLPELMRDSLALVRNELRRLRVDARIECAKALPRIYLDRVQMQQVIVNFLQNAAESMETTPVGKRRLTLRCVADDSGVEIECQDQGTGLPNNGEDCLFHPFFTTKDDGMGMGLAICRSIVEAHGGRISAANNSTGGATFRVALPILDPI